jgi:hypothetical protein
MDAARTCCLPEGRVCGEWGERGGSPMGSGDTATVVALYIADEGDEGLVRKEGGSAGDSERAIPITTAGGGGDDDATGMALLGAEAGLTATPPSPLPLRAGVKNGELSASPPTLALGRWRAAGVVMAAVYAAEGPAGDAGSLALCILSSEGQTGGTCAGSRRPTGVKEGGFESPVGHTHACSPSYRSVLRARHSCGALSPGCLMPRPFACVERSARAPPPRYRCESVAPSDVPLSEL